MTCDEFLVHMSSGTKNHILYNKALFSTLLSVEGMYRLARIYEETKYDFHDLLRLHRILQALGMEKHDIISAFELIKHNQLQTLQWKAGYLRSEIIKLEWEKRNSMYHLSNLERMINESEEILAQKRGEMAYLNRECKKLRQRIIDYNTYPLSHTPSPSLLKWLIVGPNLNSF